MSTLPSPQSALFQEVVSTAPVRSNSVTQSVPIIMLSGQAGLFDKLRGRKVGATPCLTKPFEIDSLLQLIDRHCHQAAQRI